MQLNLHQKKKIKELNEDICECCGNRGGNPRRFLNVHHMGGTHKYEHEYDLIVLCSKCHSLIHNGFKKRSNLGERTIENILLMRSFLLKKRYKNNQDLSDRIKYERAIATNYSHNTGKCKICRETKNLKIVLLDFIKKFDPENKRKLGYLLCQNCINEAK